MVVGRVIRIDAISRCRSFIRTFVRLHQRQHEETPAAAAAAPSNPEFYPSPIPGRLSSTYLPYHGQSHLPFVSFIRSHLRRCRCLCQCHAIQKHTLSQTTVHQSANLIERRLLRRSYHFAVERLAATDAFSFTPAWLNASKTTISAHHHETTFTSTHTTHAHFSAVPV